MKTTLPNIIAIVFPGLLFIHHRNFKAAVICIILQATIIGWLPAALWASMSIEDTSASRKVNNYLTSLRQYK